MGNKHARKKAENTIDDNYQTIEEVQTALQRAGLESSNLIVGIDFTKSNTWTGKHSFNGKCLHDVSGRDPNPYEQVISVVGRTLSTFDDDNIIPCFGFGDIMTHDGGVFPFWPDYEAHGFEELLARYRELAPHVNMAGPTSFAPLIRHAIDIVEREGNSYHILVIIADGVVTRSVDLSDNELSTQEQETVSAIVEASDYPLSIVVVGVGDGDDQTGFEGMKFLDDNIPDRRFDNFQFVEYNKVMRQADLPTQQEAIFARDALMEIPEQYSFIVGQRMLGQNTRRRTRIEPLPGPHIPDAAAAAAATAATTAPQPTHHANNPYGGYAAPSQQPVHNPDGPPPAHHTLPPMPVAAPMDDELPPPYSPDLDIGKGSKGDPPGATDGVAEELENLREQHLCGVCMDHGKEIAFQCGHQLCQRCSSAVDECPFCRAPIQLRIELHPS